MPSVRAKFVLCGNCGKVAPALTSRFVFNDAGEAVIICEQCQSPSQVVWKRAIRERLLQGRSLGKPVTPGYGGFGG